MSLVVSAYYYKFTFVKKNATSRKQNVQTIKTKEAIIFFSERRKYLHTFIVLFIRVRLFNLLLLKLAVMFLFASFKKIKKLKN